MSYHSNCHVDVQLRETLFLILARQCEHEISDHTGFSERTVTGYKQKLMDKLCDGGTTDMVLIYHRAKSCHELCIALANEFRQKYPALAPIVEKQHGMRIECKEEKGERKLYVWVW